MWRGHSCPRSAGRNARATRFAGQNTVCPPRTWFQYVLVAAHFAFGLRASSQSSFRKAHPGDIGHQDQIQQQCAPTEGRRLQQKTSDFEGKVNQSRQDRHPLRPHAGLPEPVRFDKPDGGISEGDQGDALELLIGDSVRKVEHGLREMAVGVDVQKLENALGDVPQVLVKQGQQSECKGNRYHALA